MTILQPGAALGILGGGQLGRMAALEARRMGYRVVIFEPDVSSPAGQVADQQIRAPYEDLDALNQFAGSVDAITLEFENVPSAAVEALSALRPVRPSVSVLRACQDRRHERTALEAAGAPTAPYRVVEQPGELEAAVATVGVPGLLKTATLGYDSKGQRVVRSVEEAEAAWNALGQAPCIYERRIDFAAEISVIVARDCYGTAVTYPIAENVHVQGILDTSVAPAPVAEPVAAEARVLALRIATTLDLVGLLAVEFFVLRDGTLIVNEMAPRPHNSGHWSIEGCVTSQFLQQVRITLGAPAGPTDLLGPVATANLLGDLWQNGTPRWDRLLEQPDISLHLYGKAGARPGRKMGHITVLGSDADDARRRVLAARRLLEA